MDTTLLQKRVVALLVLAFTASAIWLTELWSQPASSPYLQVHFLDVGQGDATLIETPDGVQVLIDGGYDQAVLRSLAQEMSYFDRTLDVVISTHPDRDHVGGLIDVLARFNVASVITSGHQGETATAVAYHDAVMREGATVVAAKRGQTLQLGASTTLKIFYPDGQTVGDDVNAASVVAQLVYGDTTFLFTGDAPKRIEEYLVLTEGEYLQSDVLQVGHHGSRTSTAESFLQEVDPQYAVISAGADNRYGHPHVEVTDLLFNERVTTFNTAEVGTVTFLSDGKTVWSQ